MKERKFTVVIDKDGKIVIDGLPVKPGDVVEVTVSVPGDEKVTRPLRGLPVRYDHPFLPAIDESDWDALR